MNAEEFKKMLADAVAPLGSNARASIVISSNGAPTFYVSAEEHWRSGSDSMNANTARTIEEAIAQIEVWVADAPLRNRVATAADLGLDVAA